MKMARTSKDFRLSKETKRMLALMPFKSNEDRNNFKKAMIDAQATEERVARDNQRGKSNGE